MKESNNPSDYIIMRNGRYLIIERVTPTVIYCTKTNGQGHYGIWRKDITRKNLIKKPKNILPFELKILTL